MRERKHTASIHECLCALLTVGHQSLVGNQSCLGEMSKRHVLPPNLLLSTPFPVLDQGRSVDPDGNSDRYSVALRITIINLKLTWSNTEAHDGI